MAEAIGMRLAKAATTYNVNIEHIVKELKDSGFVVENKPTTKLTADMVAVLDKAFGLDKAIALRADSQIIEKVDNERQPVITNMDLQEPQNFGDVNTEIEKQIEALATGEMQVEVKDKAEYEIEPEPEIKIETKYQTLEGPKQVGTIDLTRFEENPKKKEETKEVKKGAEGEAKKNRTRKLVKKKERAPLAGDDYDKKVEDFQRKRDSVFDENQDQGKSRYQKYARGKVVEAKITQIILPALAVAELPDGTIAKLPLQNVAWAFPQAQKMFREFSVGRMVKAKIISLNNSTGTVLLSAKHLEPSPSKISDWILMDSETEFSGEVDEELNSFYVVRLKNGFYGLLSKLYQDTDPFNSGTTYKIAAKLKESNLIRLVPSTIPTKPNPVIDEPSINIFSFIEPELKDYTSFKNSILGSFAPKDDLALLKTAFENNPKLFVPEFDSNITFYLNFELNRPEWEITFKQNAIPYFLEGKTFNEETEKQVLKILATQKFWIKINRRNFDNKNILAEYSLYNNDTNIYGFVIRSGENDEIKFKINNFSIGQSNEMALEKIERIQAMAPFFLMFQYQFFHLMIIILLGIHMRDCTWQLCEKFEAFEVVRKLKQESGELLRSEGVTFEIFDKFLEYQIASENDRKSNVANIFISQFSRDFAGTGGVSLIIPRESVAHLELEPGEETAVTCSVEVKSYKESKTVDMQTLAYGKLTSSADGSKLNFSREINIDALKGGFYLDKSISTKQLEIQREIIQDFINKQIKIDHIEALLINPKRIKQPVPEQFNFLNNDLVITEINNKENNQPLATRKAVGNQDIFLIQGPPGTGKSTVIAEVIPQLIQNREKVLVVAQTHVAVDNVLEKVSKNGNLNVLRVGNPERIDPELRKYHISQLSIAYREEYLKFLGNQHEIIRNIIKSKQDAIDNNGIASIDYALMINQMSMAYISNIQEIFKAKHFQLYHEIKDSSIANLSEILTVYLEWITSVNNELDLLIRPLIYASTDVVFATCIGIKSDKEFEEMEFRFDTVIIDEAGKANLAESLVAIAMAKKVILVGDQKQLPPYFDSNLLDPNETNSFPNSVYGREYKQEEIKHALTTSFFEFLTKKIEQNAFPKSNLEKLNYQHRMHPSIGEFISKTFYENEVKMGAQTHLQTLILRPPFDKEIIFFDTSNSNNPYEQIEGYSAKNNMEAKYISDQILPKLLADNVSEKQIAIIAPYKSQVDNILKHLERHEDSRFLNIDLATLDSFQGKEYDIIIFSFTRSHLRRNVGFLDDARRLNVALSRARKKLILVGNSVTLTDPKSHFDGLFNYTNLFSNLVDISKDDRIGRFINCANDSTSSSFSYTYDKPKGQLKIVSESKDAEKPNKIVLGAILTGTIKNLTEFGAFVDLGSTDGLIPRKEISWGRITHPSEVFVLGQDVKVIVLDIDQDRNRLTLGYRQLEKHPWDTLDDSICVGAIVTGRIVSIEDYGIFTQIIPGVEGLVHKSEFNWGDAPTTIHEEFKVGDSIKVVITRIDRIKQQMALSIKRLTDSPWENAKKMLPVGSVHGGEVVGIHKKIYVVLLDNGYEVTCLKPNNSNFDLRRGLKTKFQITGLDDRYEKIFATHFKTL